MKLNSKRFISGLTALALAVALLPAEAVAAGRPTDLVGGATAQERGLNMTNMPSIEAKHAFVIDSNGQVYFERDPDTESNIASITKIMTAVVALENASMDDEVTVSVAAGSVGESSSGLLPGDKLSMDDALLGLMVPSGNDAAIAIAESLGPKLLEKAKESGETLTAPDGTEIDPSSQGAGLKAFVATMNKKAVELGMSKTLYANPHGLDIGQFATDMHSSARDVATLSQYAMQNETFRNMVDLPTATIKVRRGEGEVDVVLTTTDEMLGNYEGACGIKTGFTDTAGACFSGACEREGITLYAVVLGSPTEAQRFTDTRALFDWVYNSETECKLANSDVTATMQTASGEREVPVIAEASLSDWNGRTVPVTLSNPDAVADVSSIFGNVSQDIDLESISGGVEAGDVVGKANFYQHNQLVASEDIVACVDAPAPSFFDAFGIAWERLMSFFNGSNPVADTVIHNKMPLLLEKC